MLFGSISSTQEDTPPEGYSEIRCTCADGAVRYGSFTQYAKGKGDFCKLTVYDSLPAGTVIVCEKDKTSIKINVPVREKAEWEKLSH